jgi:hypothetical protein
MRTPHSLLAVLALAGLTAVVGCNKTEDPAKPPENEPVKDTAQPGHEHGPHGGHLADLG